MGDKLTDRALVAAMRAELGLMATVRLLGWCALYASAGLEGLDDIINRGPGSPATRYRVVIQIKRVRDRLAGEGYDLTEQLEDPAVLLAVSQGNWERATA